mgnify:CR=1 FL=1
MSSYASVDHPSGTRPPRHDMAQHALSGSMAPSLVRFHVCVPSVEGPWMQFAADGRT